MYFVVRETQITSLPSNTEICLKEEMDSRDRLNKNYSKVCAIHVEIWSLEIVWHDEQEKGKTVLQITI